VSRLRLEPGDESPPVRVWRDWLLVAAVAATAMTEIAIRDDMQWRPLAVVVGLTLALTMLWRRTHPLAMASFGFGAFIVIDLVGMAERVTLLGGTIEAGPGPDQGWTVHAVIPRQGSHT
jgi:hypothetical protein